MAKFNLKKLSTGERFSLSKNWGLENIRVELTWSHADLDEHAWLLNSDGVIINNEAFVYYNSENRTEAFDRAKHGNKKNWQDLTRPMSADGAVLGSIDEQQGGIEKININLNKIDPEVQEIVVSATVFLESKEFPDVKVFGDVQDAKITIIDEGSGEALCVYELGRDYPTEDAVVTGRFTVNDDGEWEFEVVGKGYNGGLQTLVDMYS